MWSPRESAHQHPTEFARRSLPHSLRVYGKVVSCFYAVGFGAHFLDVLDLRFKFSQESSVLRLWAVYLLVADAATAIGLWSGRPIGFALFAVVAASQLAAYSLFPNTFGHEYVLMGFHAATLSSFGLIVLRLRLRAAHRE